MACSSCSSCRPVPSDFVRADPVRAEPVPTPPLSSPSWLCLQLGAREHYAIPRALHQRQALAALLTDLWVHPGSALSALPAARLHERWHPQLQHAPVWAPTRRQLLAEAWLAVRRRRSGWPAIEARNARFQRLAAARLQQLAPHLSAHTTCSPTATPPAGPCSWRAAMAGAPCSARSIPGPRRSGSWRPNGAAIPIWPPPGSRHRRATGSSGGRSWSWRIAS